MMISHHYSFSTYSIQSTVPHCISHPLINQSSHSMMGYMSAFQDRELEITVTWGVSMTALQVIQYSSAVQKRFELDPPDSAPLPRF